MFENSLEYRQRGGPDLSPRLPLLAAPRHPGGAHAAGGQGRARRRAPPGCGPSASAQIEKLAPVAHRAWSKACWSNRTASGAGTVPARVAVPGHRAGRTRASAHHRRFCRRARRRSDEVGSLMAEQKKPGLLPAPVRRRPAPATPAPEPEHHRRPRIEADILLDEVVRRLRRWCCRRTRKSRSKRRCTRPAPTIAEPVESEPAAAARPRPTDYVEALRTRSSRHRAARPPASPVTPPAERRKSRTGSSGWPPASSARRTS